MATNPLSPDGRWMLTTDGWVCLDSDPSITPDGQWTLTDGRFSQAEHIADEYLDGSVHLARDVPSNEMLPQALVSAKDSVIMGDLNVTLKQGPTMDEIHRLIVDVLNQTGATTYHTPTNISEAHRRLISERIDTYDQLISGGAGSDPATELLVATAANVKGDYDDARRRLAEILRAHPESPEASDAIQVLAQISIRLGDWKEAEKWVNQAMSMFEENGNWHGLGNTLMKRARVLTHRQDHERALEMYQEATEIAKRHKLKRLHARSVANRGFLLYEIGTTSQAKQVLSESLQFALEARDPTSVSMIREKLSDIYKMEGDLVSASRLLRESRADLQDTDDKFTQGERVLAEAKIQEKRNNLKMAQNLYQKAERLFSDIGANNKQGEICLILAELDENKDDFTSAISWYTKALECFRDPPKPENRRFCLAELGNLYLMTRELAESIKSSSLAINLAVQLNEHEQQLTSLLTLCAAQYYNGDVSGARSSLLTARELASNHGLDDDRFPTLDAMLASTRR